MGRRTGGITAGALLGGVAAFSPGTVFILLLALLFALVLRAVTAPSDRRLVVGLFVAGFCLRAALSLGLDLGSRFAEGGWPSRNGPVQGWELNVRDRTRSFLKLGDSDFFSERAYAFSEYVRGRRETVLFLCVKKPRPHGYLYPMALFYSYFEFSPISVKFLNCLVGALMGPVLFFLGLACFNRAVAQWAAVISSFLPSLMLWSATNLKDPGFILLTALLFLLVVKIQEVRSPRDLGLYLLLFIPTFLLHTTLRSDAGFSWALVGCAVAAWVLGRIPPVWRLTGAAAAALSVIPFWPRLFERLVFAFYRHLGNVDTVSTPDTLTYRYLPPAFYTGDLFSEAAKMRDNLPLVIVTFGRAIGHYLVEPLPSRMGDFSSMMVYPQMVLWYALLPFAAWGIGMELRHNFRNSAFLAFCLIVWTVISALASGNIGLLFRIRDMVTPFILIFACAGLLRWLQPGRSLFSC